VSHAETLSARTAGSSSGRVRCREELEALLVSLPRPEPVAVAAPVERRRSTVPFALTCAAVVVAAGLIADPRGVEDPAMVHERIDRELTVLSDLVEQYHRDARAYPNAAAWRLSVGREDRRFFDPWHRPYIYRIDDQTFSIASYGADGEPGGEGVDQDIERSFPRRRQEVSDR